MQLKTDKCNFIHLDRCVKALLRTFPVIDLPRTETPIISHEPNSTRMALLLSQRPILWSYLTHCSCRNRTGVTTRDWTERDSRMCGWGASYSVNRILKHVSNKTITLFHPGFYCYLGRAFVHPPEKMHFFWAVETKEWLGSWLFEIYHSLKLNFYSEINVFWRPHIVKSDEFT